MTVIATSAVINKAALFITTLYSLLMKCLITNVVKRKRAGLYISFMISYWPQSILRRNSSGLIIKANLRIKSIKLRRFFFLFAERSSLVGFTPISSN